MRQLIVAIGFLTRFPVPRFSASEVDFAAAIRLYPAAGLLIGAAVAVATWLGAIVDPWLGAVAGLCAWIAATGALHLDGLGDLADGLGAAHGRRDRLLAVMSDPHVGSFGVVAIGLQLIAKLVLLHLFSTNVAWLVVIPMAARVGPLVWALSLPALKMEGLGAAIAGAARWRDVAGWLVPIAGLAFWMPWLIATPLLIAGYAVWVRAKVGGMTGDVHGAGIELMETGLCLACAVYAAV